VHHNVVNHIIIAQHQPPREVQTTAAAATAPARCCTGDAHSVGRNAHDARKVLYPARQQGFGLLSTLFFQLGCELHGGGLPLLHQLLFFDNPHRFALHNTLNFTR